MNYVIFAAQLNSELDRHFSLLPESYMPPMSASRYWLQYTCSQQVAAGRFTLQRTLFQKLQNGESLVSAEWYSSRLTDQQRQEPQIASAMQLALTLISAFQEREARD